MAAFSRKKDVTIVELICFPAAAKQTSKQHSGILSNVQGRGSKTNT